MHRTNTVPNKLLFLLLILAFLGGCQCNKNRKNVDVSDISVQLEVDRFEQELAQLDTTRMQQEVLQLQSQYPSFFPVYAEQIMGFGQLQKDTQQVVRDIQTYLNDPYVKEVFDDCDSVFADFSPYQQQLEKAFKHYRYYYPGHPVPNIITFISNFSLSAATIDSVTLAIGVDLHLGTEYPYYSDLYPQYMYSTFTPEYLTANAMQAWATNVHTFQRQDNTLLAAMIANGMSLYFTELMMPDAPDHVIMGYLEEDIEWCKENEPYIWQFFIERELLYTTEQSEFKYYVAPGPRSSRMNPNAPGNIGSWVGWQIVRRYFNNHPEKSFQEVLNNYQPQLILSESKYKPAF